MPETYEEDRKHKCRECTGMRRNDKNPDMSYCETYQHDMPWGKTFDGCEYFVHGAPKNAPKGGNGAVDATGPAIHESAMDKLMGVMEKMDARLTAIENKPRGRGPGKKPSQAKVRKKMPEWEKIERREARKKAEVEKEAKLNESIKALAESEPPALEDMERVSAN